MPCQGQGLAELKIIYLPVLSHWPEEEPELLSFLFQRLRLSFSVWQLSKPVPCIFWQISQGVQIFSLACSSIHWETSTKVCFSEFSEMFCNLSQVKKQEKWLNSCTSRQNWWNRHESTCYTVLHLPAALSKVRQKRTLEIKSLKMCKNCLILFLLVTLN